MKSFSVFVHPHIVNPSRTVSVPRGLEGFGKHPGVLVVQFSLQHSQHSHTEQEVRLYGQQSTAAGVQHSLQCDTKWQGSSSRGLDTILLSKECWLSN